MTIDAASARENRQLRRAQQYLVDHNLSAAQTTLESLLQRRPNDPIVCLLLSRVHYQRGHVRQAATYVHDALPALPDDAKTIADAAQALFEVGETVAARDLLKHPEVQRTESEAALVQLAHVHHVLGQGRQALELMDRAMQVGHDAPTGHHFRAMLLQFVGRMRDAEQLLDTTLERWPGFGDAALTRSRLHRQTPATQHLEFLHAQSQRPHLNSVSHASAHFALFKELDDLGRYDEAWANLKQANELMYARRAYDLETNTRLVDALIAHTRPIPTEAAQAASPGSGPQPIFVLGIPRSGTTLLDRMISSHSQVTSAGEISDFFRQWRALGNVGNDPDALYDGICRSVNLDFHELGQGYLQQTQWRAQGHAFFIDKMPNNFVHIGYIHRALPHARILHIIREPMAVCFSNYKAMFGDGSEHSYDWHAMNQYYQLQQRLRQHWQTICPDAVLEVDYSKLVTAAESEMRKVLDFCGLELEDACLHPARNTAPVSTPSSAQVREPIHTRGIDDWLHYEKFLQPLQDREADLR